MLYVKLETRVPPEADAYAGGCAYFVQYITCQQPAHHPDHLVSWSHLASSRFDRVSSTWSSLQYQDNM